MLYMIIEHFKDGDAKPVYRRFGERGRMMPDGLRYVASWVTDDLARCFQVVETNDETLISVWTRGWDDLIDFEVLPVVTGTEAVAALGLS